MRFGFVSDVWASSRGAATILRPATMLLRPHPAAALAPPGPTGPQLYAGVVELTTTQHADLQGAAALAGVRLLTVPLADPEDTTLLPLADRALAAAFLGEAGVLATPSLEGRAVILDRLARRLCPARGMRHCWNQLAARLRRP